MKFDYMKEDPIELGEKILFLVNEFEKNPSIFENMHKCILSYEDKKYYKLQCVREGKIILSILSDNSSYCNRLLSSSPDDFIMFTLNCDDRNLSISENNSSKYTKYYFLDKDYSEEELFQMSTVLDTLHINTIQLFLYFKKYSKHAFKINLSEVDINAAVHAYKIAH